MTASFPARFGTALWSSPEWRAAAMEWLDDRLAEAGVERSGDVVQPRVRPWSTVLRVPTTAGVVWFKAAGPATAFEVGLYEILARIAPERVLVPIAADPARGWIVLPDGGPSLGERLAGPAQTDALVAALQQYGALQRDLAPHVDDILAVGVADMRPRVMPHRFEQALDTTGATIDSRGGDPDARAMHRRVAAMRGRFTSWCERLSRSRVPASIDHNDLHPWNVLGDGSGSARFYDWGDSVVAHPFAALLVPLGFVQRQLDVPLDHPRFTTARDAYLEGFAAGPPGEDLAGTLELACRIAKVARVLTWDRALQAARDEGDEIVDDWVAAPLATLASLLEPSYLGGA